MTFDSKTVIGIATLNKILNDVGVISEKITIDTNSNSSISIIKLLQYSSGDSDRGESRVTMDADDDDKSKLNCCRQSQ